MSMIICLLFIRFNTIGKGMALDISRVGAMEDHFDSAAELVCCVLDAR